MEATPIPYKRAIILAVHTVPRRTELFTLPWSYLHVHYSFIVFPTGPKKAGNSHSVDLNPTTYGALRDIRDEQQCEVLTPQQVFYKPATPKPTNPHFNRW